MVVRPGDLIVGDGDGLLVVPAEEAEDIAVCVEQIQRNEAGILQSIAQGRADRTWVDRSLADKGYCESVGHRTRGQRQVVRFDYWLDPAFNRIVSERPAFAYIRVNAKGLTTRPGHASPQAHVYQITAAKDELPRRWFVTAELLARCPNLVAVSSSGSGCDTIDIDACTAAGVVVMNRAGGNADSVAEMAVGLMLSVMRRIPESDRHMKAHSTGSREDLMGHELVGGRWVW